MDMDGLSRFDVAIWPKWSPWWDGIPLIGQVSAPDAAMAVVGMMRVFGLTTAGHVAARDLQRRFVHRAYGVRLPEREPAFVRKAEEAERWEPSGSSSILGA